MLDQLRADWIANPKRGAVTAAIKSAIETVLKDALPLVPDVVIDAVANAAIQTLDDVATQAVKIQTGTVTIKDHRG